MSNRFVFSSTSACKSKQNRIKNKIVSCNEKSVLWFNIYTKSSIYVTTIELEIDRALGNNKNQKKKNLKINKLLKTS